MNINLFNPSAILAASDTDVLVGVTLMIGLGVLAQWVGWRMRIPSILPLLACGLLVGPLSTLWSPSGRPLLDPDALLGSTVLVQLVSLAVGLILYEGGLTLNIREIAGVGGVVRNLVSIAILVTWILGAISAWLILNVDVQVALLLGAVLVVSGPTVVVPLLRLLRPTGQLGPVIKWEGIVNDPIGALLAVLVFEAIMQGGDASTTWSHVVSAVLQTTFIAGGAGVIGGLGLALLFRYHLVPDYLQNAASLALAILIFTTTNLMQTEAGLFAVTVMGIVVANQRLAKVDHIIEFKEELRVLLIALLFIALAARLTMEEIGVIDWRALLFVATLILIVRPLAVAASTVGTGMSLRERVLLGWLAPRGIVAAAVSAIFGARLVEQGNIQGAELIGPVTFLVIVCTVMTYGLTTIPLARWLGIADANPQGVLIIGAHEWARRLAEVLDGLKVRVLLVDSNWQNVSTGRLEKLNTHLGSALDEHIEERLDLRGLGHLLAVTRNDEVNTLAAEHFGRTFGAAQTYQLAPRGAPGSSPRLVDLPGRILFDADVRFDELRRRVESGERFRATDLTDAFSLADFREKNGDASLIVMIVRGNGQVVPVTRSAEMQPKAGDTLISLGPVSEKSR